MTLTRSQLLLERLRTALNGPRAIDPAVGRTVLAVPTPIRGTDGRWYVVTTEGPFPSESVAKTYAAMLKQVRP